MCTFNFECGERDTSTFKDRRRDAYILPETLRNWPKNNNKKKILKYTASTQSSATPTPRKCICQPCNIHSLSQHMHCKFICNSCLQKILRKSKIQQT